MLGASGNAFSKGRDFAGKLVAPVSPQSGLVAHAAKHLVANEVEANAIAYFKKIWDIALECTRY